MIPIRVREMVRAVLAVAPAVAHVIYMYSNIVFFFGGFAQNGNIGPPPSGIKTPPYLSGLQVMY